MDLGNLNDINEMSILSSKGFNLQRILEHSLLRDRDVIAYSLASQTDARLIRGTVYRVGLADIEPLPPIAEVCLRASPHEHYTVTIM
jgi:hypothetical protein